MGKLVHTVNLPDGTTDTRESDTRAYTHVVIVVTTEAERARRVSLIEAKIAGLEKQIAGLRAAAADSIDLHLYNQALARLAFLGEDITEECTRNDGSKYTATHPRWLSNENRGNGRSLLDHAERARDTTANGKIANAEKEIAFERQKLGTAQERTIGAAGIYRWSMSLRGAQQGMSEVLNHRPLDKVFISTEIAVRERATRTKKSA